MHSAPFLQPDEIAHLLPHQMIEFKFQYVTDTTMVLRKTQEENSKFQTEIFFE
jgi:hypothetical protein